MDCKGILLWVFLIAIVGGGVSFCVVSTISRLDVGFAQNQTELNKTGYATDIGFIDGDTDAFGKQTIVRFGDGDAVVLEYWETKIPIKQNITLDYHDNGYRLCFLDNFTIVEDCNKNPWWNASWKCRINLSSGLKGHLYYSPNCTEEQINVFIKRNCTRYNDFSGCYMRIVDEREQ